MYSVLAQHTQHGRHDELTSAAHHGRRRLSPCLCYTRRAHSEQPSSLGSAAQVATCRRTRDSGAAPHLHRRRLALFHQVHEHSGARAGATSRTARILGIWQHSAHRLCPLLLALPPRRRLPQRYRCSLLRARIIASAARTHSAAMYARCSASVMRAGRAKCCIVTATHCAPPSARSAAPSAAARRAPMLRARVRARACAARRKAPHAALELGSVTASSNPQLSPSEWRPRRARRWRR